MTGETFKQTSSIINRLRTIMILIAVFILLYTVALYFSSLRTLRGLQDLNSANNLLNLNSQIVESISTAEKDLDAIAVNSNIRHLRFSYQENLKVTFGLINESIQLAKDDSSFLIEMFNEAKNLLDQSDIHYRNIFTKIILERKDSGVPLSKKMESEIMSDMLVAKQFIMDAKEVLRKIQIAVKIKNDKDFSITYENRFVPLIVAITLSIFLFSFVVIYGLSISRKIGTSIPNLLRATDRVAHGDLSQHVKILDRDEVGRLTFAFNKMILSMKSTQDSMLRAVDKTKRLQAITASFSEALTLEQVYEIIFVQAFEALNAVAASVVVVSEDKNHLEIKRAVGHDPEVIARWKRFPIAIDIPITQTVRFKRPIYIDTEDYEKLREMNPKDFPSNTHRMASLPLMISSEAFGALSLHFSTNRVFDQEEKDFMMALARQCSQAIHRSQLYDDAKKAIEARDEFLSIASHELKTPLTPLILQVQRMIGLIKNNKAEALTPEKIKNVSESFDRQLKRLSKLIDNLLDVSRINTGKLTLQKSYFSLKEMIDEVLVHYSQHLKETNSTVDYNVTKDAVGFWDKVRIEQVFINLLTNAAKYAPSRPIHIAVTNDGKKARIQVRDEGSGIPAEDHVRIFNRFERGLSSETVGGLGLGLYISKQIVEAHAGHIFLEGSGGQGTSFVVELPLMPTENVLQISNQKYPSL